MLWYKGSYSTYHLGKEKLRVIVDHPNLVNATPHGIVFRSPSAFPLHPYTLIIILNLLAVLFFLFFLFFLCCIPLLIQAGHCITNSYIRSEASFWVHQVPVPRLVAISFHLVHLCATRSAGDINTETSGTNTSLAQAYKPNLTPAFIFAFVKHPYKHSLQAIGMGLFRAAAAATFYCASTILAQGQSSSQAGNGASGGILCGAGNLCPESSPCCSRKDVCLVAPWQMLIASSSRIRPMRCGGLLSRWL